MPIDWRATAEAEGIPIVECLKHPQQEDWPRELWIIMSCPFCGEVHVHEAGAGFSAAHCFPTRLKATYYLVDSGRTW